MKPNKKFSKLVINLVGGVLGGLGSVSTVVFLKDRHKQLLQEIRDNSLSKEQIESISDDDVKKVRDLSSVDFKNIANDEIKETLGKLKMENERRENTFKQLQEIREKNKID